MIPSLCRSLCPSPRVAAEMRLLSGADDDDDADPADAMTVMVMEGRLEHHYCAGRIALTLLLYAALERRKIWTPSRAGSRVELLTRARARA